MRKRGLGLPIEIQTCIHFFIEQPRRLQVTLNHHCVMSQLLSTTNVVKKRISEDWLEERQMYFDLLFGLLIRGYRQFANKSCVIL